MQPDKTLARHLLAILERVGAQTIEERALKVELETVADRPITSHDYADLLEACRSQGWVMARYDQWGDRRWWISESGRTIRAGM